MREGQTMTMAAVIFFQIFCLLNCRSLQSSVSKLEVFSNRSVSLGVAVLALALAQATLMYRPLLRGTFGTAPLPVSDLALAARC